jgi:hypothetical protein
MATKNSLGLISLLLCVVLVTAASGCIGNLGGGGTTASGSGVVINTFEPRLANVESGESTSLHLEVQNTGDFNNAPTVAELTGINLQEWSVSDQYKDLGQLLAPDPDSETEGGMAAADWEMTAPQLFERQSQTYEPITRVYYYYETRAIKPVLFVTAEELRRIVDSGEAFQTEATTMTSGPITADITAGKFVKSRDWQSSKFTLQVHLGNAGGGFIFGKDYPVYVEIEWPDGITPVGDCPREIGYGFSWYENLPPGLRQPSFGRVVRLWKNEETDVFCEFQVSQPPTNRVTKNFEVKLGYIYYTDKHTTLTVKGTEQF